MKLNCPNISCHSHYKNFVKIGYYFRKCDSKYIQRFRCKACLKNFSHATGKLEFRHKIRREVPLIRSMYASGVSMRRMAKILKLQRKTINRKVVYLGIKSDRKLKFFRDSLICNPIKKLQFDDLITIEHSKMKPLSVSIAIDEESRKFLGFAVSRIPAFGHLAQKSRNKYGKRPNELKKGLKNLFEQIKESVHPEANIKSDEHQLYPNFVKKYFPDANYERFKGAPGSIAGQGELKKLKYDPLFTLNHNFAMLRANINRLVRRTWCTTKDPQMLATHLSIYMEYHNSELV